MAFGRETTAANVKPLEGAIIRRYTAGAAIEAGEIVSMQSDGKVDPTDTTGAVATNVGIALNAAADGNRVDVVISGPVQCILEGTPGAVIYDSTTAGEPAASASGNQKPVGFAESATVLFVRI